MSFDEIIAPKIAENSPKGKHPGTGDKEAAMDSMLYSHIKGENDKPHNNVQFRGLVLYKSILSFEQFQSKYDPTFVAYCTKASPEFEGDLKEISSFNILETRVYIQELCSCLPQPENTELFFENMKKVIKMSKDLKSSRESPDNPTISLKDMIKLSRYPKAYMIIGKGIKPVAVQSIVDVQFPYNFDFSYGVITGEPSR
tara:strand:- start:3030 stop:3626 length:597 start_codon:yes stop_codon:yes gene_type:complete